MPTAGFFVKSTEAAGDHNLCYTIIPITIIISTHLGVCVLWKEKKSFLWDVLSFFWQDTRTYLSVYFFILLYINAKACVDIVYICLFDMKNNVMARSKSTLHTCTMHRCIIEIQCMCVGVFHRASHRHGS